MTMTTARHKLPLLVPGQAQKEVFHNESLNAIDMLLHATVEAVGIDTPPFAPAEGQSWIVGRTPTGEWSGHMNALASWTAGGWRFQDAGPGLSVTVRTSGLRADWKGAEWRVGDVAAVRVMIGGVQLLGPRQPAIPDPAGGMVIDGEVRKAVVSMLAALRTHGLIA